MNRKMNIACGDTEAIEKSLQFIDESLSEIGIQNKQVMRTQLAAEEIISLFIQNADSDAVLHIQVQKLLSDASVSIEAEGQEVDAFEGSPGGEDSLDAMPEDNAQTAISQAILRSMGNNLKLIYRGGKNLARIVVGQTGPSMLFMTIGMLVSGLLFGFMMKSIFPDTFSDGLSFYLMNPVKTMFMNALKIIIGPVVFFSIVSCIAQFRDLAELGRIAAKVVGIYLLTTVLAVLLGLGVSALLHPGTPGFALSFSEGVESVEVNTDMDTSLLTTIVNIVPFNFFKPFLESDTLQIIFLGVLCGVAVGKIGKYAPVLQDFFEACNSLFLTITTMISKLIPFAVFCSSALLVTDLGGASMLSVLGYAGTEILAIIFMLMIYGILLFTVGRLNPFTFYRKNREGMLTSFTLSSSSAAMPTNMRICMDKLGISPKVCSFSIPLGATINMDGGCIFMTVSGLFLARAYGVNLSGTAIFSMALTVILLSLGAPGVPGAALVCMGVVLGSIGVPIEAIGLVIGVNPIIDMFNTMSNTTGDVVATTIVAKSEGLLDMEKYNS